MGTNNVEIQTITAFNTFTEKLAVVGPAYVVLSGTWVATVTLQISFDDGVTWFDVEQFTATGVFTFDNYERDVVFRVGVKAISADFTSGTITARMSF